MERRMITFTVDGKNGNGICVCVYRSYLSTDKGDNIPVDYAIIKPDESKRDIIHVLVSDITGVE